MARGAWYWIEDCVVALTDGGYGLGSLAGTTMERLDDEQRQQATSRACGEADLARPGLSVEEIVTAAPRHG
jgi:hypothetical protein